MQLFEKYGSTSKRVVFKRGMENMLGKFGYPNGEKTEVESLRRKRHPQAPRSTNKITRIFDLVSLIWRLQPIEPMILEDISEISWRDMSQVHSTHFAVWWPSVGSTYPTRFDLRGSSMCARWAKMAVFTCLPQMVARWAMPQKTPERWIFELNRLLEPLGKGKQPENGKSRIFNQRSDTV